MQLKLRKSGAHFFAILGAGALLFIFACSSSQNLTGASDDTKGANPELGASTEDKTDNSNPPPNDTNPGTGQQTGSLQPSSGNNNQGLSTSSQTPNLEYKLGSSSTLAVAQAEEPQIAEKSNALYQSILLGNPINLNPPKKDTPHPILASGQVFQTAENPKELEKSNNPLLSIPAGTKVQINSYFHVLFAYPGPNSVWQWSEIHLTKTYWMPSVYFDAPIDYKTLTTDTVKLYFTLGESHIYLEMAPVLVDGFLLDDGWTSGDPNRLKYYVDYHGSLANPKSYTNNNMTFLVVLKGGSHGAKDLNGDLLTGNVTKDNILYDYENNPMMEVGDYSWTFSFVK